MSRTRVSNHTSAKTQIAKHLASPSIRSHLASGTGTSPYCCRNAKGLLGPPAFGSPTPPLSCVKAVVRGVIGFLWPKPAVFGVLGKFRNICRFLSHFSSCVRPASALFQVYLAFLSSMSSLYSSSRSDFSVLVMKQDQIARPK